MSRVWHHLCRDFKPRQLEGDCTCPSCGATRAAGAPSAPAPAPRQQPVPMEERCTCCGKPLKFMDGWRFHQMGAPPSEVARFCADCGAKAWGIARQMSPPTRGQTPRK